MTCYYITGGEDKVRLAKRGSSTVEPRRELILKHHEHLCCCHHLLLLLLSNDQPHRHQHSFTYTYTHISRASPPPLPEPVHVIRVNLWPIHGVLTRWVFCLSKNTESPMVHKKYPHIVKKIDAANDILLENKNKSKKPKKKLEMHSHIPLPKPNSLLQFNQAAPSFI